MLFDLDGVLVRSHETWLKLMQDASAHFGGRPVTREEFAPLFGQGPEADIAIFGLHCTREELDAYLAQVPYVTEHVWERIEVERMNVVLLNREFVQKV